MLTFKNTSIAFLLLMVMLAGLYFFKAIPLIVFLPVVIVYLALLVYGSYFVDSGFFVDVICAGNTAEKKIALSFDDGPVPASTPALLDILTRYKVSAAFFCIGHRIKGNEAIVKNIHDKGHIIGNHSYSHHYLFDFFTSEKMLADLRQMDQTLLEALPIKPRLFRPPYGVTTPAMNKALQQGNYTPVGWNIRSMDTVIKNERKLFDKVTKALKPGAIVLFHDTGKTTLAVLPAVIEYAQSNGYVFERLDKLINEEAYA